MHIGIKLLALAPALTLLAVDFPPIRHPVDLSQLVAPGEFPAHDLFDALQRGDVVRMRRHSWNLFAGLTSRDAGDVKAPIFLSWYTKANLFGSPTEDHGRFGLEAPLQLLDLALPTAPDKAGTAVKRIDPTQSPVVDKEYFNTSAFTFITTNNLNDIATVKKMNCNLGSLPAEDRQIKSFPNDAVAIKTIWRFASGTKLTLLPVWDPESNSSQPLGNDPDNLKYVAGLWPRYVAVNPSLSGIGPSTDMPADSGPLQTAPVVPISSFYNILLTADMLGMAQAAVAPGPSFTPQPGDYLILVGLHVTTKEIPNWVWATFWWHDQPDNGPFAANRPSSVRGPWRNYLMNVAYDMNDPREPDGSPHINFNPYLETKRVGGVTSNCMTCHRLAAWPPPDLTAKPGAISVADDRFKGRIRLDFLWSLTGINGAPTDTTCVSK